MRVRALSVAMVCLGASASCATKENPLWGLSASGGDGSTSASATTTGSPESASGATTTSTSGDSGSTSTDVTTAAGGGSSSGDGNSVTIELPLLADTFVVESDPDADHATEPFLEMDGDDNGGVTLGLVLFDVSSIPAGSQVQTATLSLTTVEVGDGATGHRMLVIWGEDATWNILGGVQADDVKALVAADFTADVLMVDAPTQHEVAAGVQAWVDGAPNHGWALIPLSGEDGWDISSREGADPPELSVTYLPP